MRDFTGVSGASGGLADDDTRWTPAVANSIVQEIKTVITDPTGGNVALDPDDNGQLLAAIIAIAGASGLFAEIDSGTGFRVGTFYVKTGAWGEGFNPFTSPFPNVCLDVFPTLTTIPDGGDSNDETLYRSGMNVNGFTMAVSGDHNAAAGTYTAIGK